MQGNEESLKFGAPVAHVSVHRMFSHWGNPLRSVVTVTLEMAYNLPGTGREDGQVGLTAALF